MPTARTGTAHSRLIGICARPAAAWLAAAVGILCTLPAIGTGLFADDYLQRTILLGRGPIGAGAQPFWDLFQFVPTGPRRAAAIEIGTLTWWAHPDLHIALFRPVAVLTHLIDYGLWPETIPAQHLHSVVWYGLAVFMVATLYRRVHGAGVVAGIAALLFAIDDGHAMCAGWLANRHALLALTFGMAAMHAHRHWRVGDGRLWAVLSVSALAVALGCSEAGLSAAAYIVAWECTMEPGAWPRRLAALLPYALLVVTWRVVYERLGFGTHGSALYLDPGHDPVAFGLALLERWPLLQAAQWFHVPIDFFVLLPGAGQAAGFIAAVAVVFMLARVFWPLVRERHEARFWVAGASLSLVPLCAAFPMDRLLLFAGVGTFPLLAMLAERCGLFGGEAVSATGRRFASLMLVLHGPLAAALLLVRVATLSLFGELLVAGAWPAPADATSPRQTYVFVTGHEFPVIYLAIARQLEQPATAPRRVALLAPLSSASRVRRQATDTLVVTVAEGYLAHAIDQLLRRPDCSFHVGELVSRPDFVAEVRSVTADGRPMEVAFHFRKPLESDDYRWLAWGPTGAEPFPLPRVGEQVDLPARSLLR